MTRRIFASLAGVAWIMALLALNHWMPSQANGEGVDFAQIIPFVPDRGMINRQGSLELINDKLNALHEELGHVHMICLATLFVASLALFVAALAMKSDRHSRSSEKDPFAD